MKAKYLVIMGVLLAAAGLFSYYMNILDYRSMETVKIAHFPRTIGPWTSVDIPLTPQDLAILETDNVLARRYRNPDGETVELLMVYSQLNRKVSHPPEVCYTGTGVSILEEKSDTLALAYRHMLIPAKRLLLQQHQMYEAVYYWFKAGDAFTSNYWNQQALIVWHTLNGQGAGNALIRLSTDFDPKNPQKSVDRIREFAGRLAPLIFQYLS